MASLSARYQLSVLFLCLLVVIANAIPQNGQNSNTAGKRKRGGGGQQHNQQTRPKPNNAETASKAKPHHVKPAHTDDNADGNLVKQRIVTKLIPDLGRIRGRVIKSEWSGKDIMQFYDIPYGKSPAGIMRFKPAEPAAAWEGTLNAIKPHAGCPSLQNIEKYEELEADDVDIEDCLRLTVSSKALGAQKAPVMVYVHGDFLYDGSSIEAQPGYLLEENIVLVAVRYRLGPFGFLSTMSEDIPGNAAVHDVILALKWIQKHIESFGGDASRVTLFGQVGGAALINVLTLSPAVPNNLFHRVIYQSASALSPAFITDNPLAASKDIARFAGCKNANKVEAVNRCLRKLNTTTILTAFNSHGDAKASMGVGSYGAVQFVIGGPSGILPEHPGKLLAAEKFKAYPTIGGAVKNAGTFILKDIYMDNFNETIIDDKLNGLGYIDHIIEQTNGADPTGAWKKHAEEEIFEAADIKNGTFYSMAPGLIDMCSVIPFKNPVLLTMQANAKKLPNNTFLYSFDHAGEVNRYTTSEDDEGAMPFELGVSLTDDNLYLFPWPRFRNLNSLRDIKIAKRMVAYWTSFAATGIPKANGSPDWPPMTDETGPYLKIGKLVTVADNYLDEYRTAVRESQMGYNLVNEEFFDSLVEINENDKDNEDDDENDDSDQGRGTNFVIIGPKDETVAANIIFRKKKEREKRKFESVAEKISFQKIWKLL